MDYFISDTHFGHKNILTFERTQFKTIQEHDDFIWKKLGKLTVNDTLYHLGDFGVLDETTTARWKALPCKTILIRGNHDGSIGQLKAIFDEVHNEPVFYKKRILLSHEPLPVTDGTLNVHGHLHSARLNKPNYLNISMHMVDYKLITEKDLVKYLTILPKDNFKFMFEWYAEDYEFTIPNKDVIFKDGKIDLTATRDHLITKKSR